MDKDKKAEEDALEQLMALPFDAFLRGPPKTPCHTERSAYVDEIGIMDRPPDPQVEHILTLVARIFRVQCVLVCLCAHERVYIRNAHGFAAGDFPWRWGFCGWGIATPNPEVLVIEDAREDARMRKNQATVDKEGGMRFFAGVPLVGSSGHRLGMLIIIDQEPRRVSADQMAILANMSELVVRELEKDAAVAARQAAVAAAGAEMQHYMRRALACFDERAVLFVDVRTEAAGGSAAWSTLHANAAVSQVTGVSFEESTTQQLWDLFELPFSRGSELFQAMGEMAARGDEFVLRGVALHGRPARGTFTLMFRPGRSGALDEDSQLVGVPSYVPSAPANTPAEYFFVIITPEDAADLQSSGLLQTAQDIALRRNMPPNKIPIEGLQLGPLLGKGSFGRVYRGRFHDRPVAVKICSVSLGSDGRQAKPWRSVEAVQARRLDHPGVMRTYKHTSVLVSCEGEVQKVGGGSSGSDGGSIGGRFQTESWGDQGGWSDDEVQEGAVEKEAELETWLVLEYANRGSLESGIDRGWFQSEKTSTGRGPPSLPVLLHIARTLADAMAYLHNLDIIHGDLCGGNVLLTSSDAVPHRFTCKVADFGLARELYLQTRMETASYGTVTHMPPELLTEGKLSKAADVFAFGVLLWEMATGSRAWAGMSHTQVLTAVGYHHKRPIFPDYIDKDIAALANACMAQDARKRPTFREVVAAVDAKLAEVQKASFGQAASPFASWKPPPRQAST